jgi:magnesium transporter
MPPKKISTLDVPNKPIWLDSINPPLDEVDAIIEKYGFHTLDREAILEENQYARIDSYDDYLFLVLHFPKYEQNTERYISNEFNIFLSKEYLITFRYYQTEGLKKRYSEYLEDHRNEKYLHPAFILYEVIELLLEKVMRMLERFGKDLKILERELFSTNGTDLIRKIMVKKRNIITLKHMMKPQLAVLKLLEIRINERFNEEMEVYFEDLEDKLDKIYSEIQLLQENIDSMEDTLKSVFELQTNTTIQYLTLFSAFLLPLTLVTSFFGMNTETGHFDNGIILISFIFTFIGLIIITYLFTKKNKI